MKETLMTIQMWAGHALVLSNTPVGKVKNLNLTPTESGDIEKFGLFDSASPNYTTYYPEVDPKELTPDDEEFIYPVFRLLSNVIINNSIEFPEEVLKASIPLIIGQSVYPDHEAMTGNAMGVVLSAYWQDSYKIGGKKVPGGINGTFKLDGKANPRIARGIMMDPPSIHSNSVTVSFTWVKSHPELTDDEFYNKIGTFDKKGVLVRRVADKIVMYHETSLVPHGADPFAQKVGEDGKIVLPKYAFVRNERFADKNQYSQEIINVDYKALTESPTTHSTLSLSASTLENPTNTGTKLKTKPNMNEKLLALIAAHFKFDVAALTEETYETTVREILSAHESAIRDSVTAEFTPQIATLNQSIADLTAKVTDLTAKADSVVIKLREEATKFYKLLAGETPDQAILDNISKADFALATSLLNQYQSAFEEKLPLTCGKCGSTNVSRKSTVDPPKSEEVDEYTETKEKVSKRRPNLFSGGKEK